MQELRTQKKLQAIAEHIRDDLIIQVLEKASKNLSIIQKK